MSATGILQAGSAGDRIGKYVTARGLALQAVTYSSMPRAAQTAFMIERNIENVTLVKCPTLAEGEIPHSTGGVSGRDVS